MKQTTEIVKRTLLVINPILMLFGFYLIYNGHLSPGGGFQGGTVLVGSYISRYLISNDFPNEIERLRALEKYLFMMIILVILLIGVYQVLPRTELTQTVYLISLNFLIGIKVFIGLTIIFIKFITTDDGGDN